MVKVLGLDVSKSSISACLLETKPNSPRQFYYDCPFYRLSANSEGLRELLALKPDIAVLEPTGTNYSKIWSSCLANAGVEIRLVGHKELRNYRSNHLALPDKDDDGDSLALACYYFDYCTDPKRFVQIRDHEIVKIRELVLRLGHLNRVQNPIACRIRQDLAWQFPEVAHTRSRRQNESQKIPIFWAWLAGERKSKKYDELYQNTIGLGITRTVKVHAERLCHLQREEIAIERELRQMLNNPKFEPYIKVFKKFGFGQRVTAILLSQIYPISAFMGEDGKPEVRTLQGRNSKKPTKRYFSLRRFQKALGVAPTQESSGDKKKTKMVGGSDLCRTALWQWIFTRIEPRKCRMKNKIGQELGAKLDKQKSTGRPINWVRMHVATAAVKMLFNELVKALTTDN